MSISKATFIAALTRFKFDMLKAVQEGWVEDPDDGSKLMTLEQSNKLDGMTGDEDITDAEIDALFNKPADKPNAEAGAQPEPEANQETPASEGEERS